MKSYSKIFKASGLSVVEGTKVFHEPVPVQPEGHESQDGMAGQEQGHIPMKVIAEAQQKAAEIIRAAEQQAAELEAAAETTINDWWKTNEARFENLSLEARQQGFEEGYKNGRLQAEEEARNEYAGKLAKIQRLLEEAYEQKEMIISEAEPFLLELSTVIASRILKQELESSPQKLVELIKEQIMRFKEKEYITICVHPDDFDFIQSQRAHLAALVNGETEMKIIPDHSVTEKGCIIRTDYGSIDARIDTQVEEIKKAILEARRGPGK